MEKTPHFAERTASYTSRLEQQMEYLLPSGQERPTRLHQAMRYAMLGGGKRIRPLLCYATGEVLGVTADKLDMAACAVEMIHGFSLIHDDLPAMDDDPLRRGQPTVHVAFDTATAILAGDALQTLAFETLSQSQNSPESRLMMIQTLAQATGSRGMTGGQAMDLEAEEQQIETSELEDLNQRKTGCLMQASILMACDANPQLPANTRKQLQQFASNIGLAFQIRDDLLDVEGDEALTGKASGADAAHNKATWPELLGAENARQRANLAHQASLDALKNIEGNTEPLCWMARYIIQRNR